MNLQHEIETLQRLKRACEIGIHLLESGIIVKDPHANPAPYDFTVGGFGVVELKTGLKFKRCPGDGQK